MTTIETAALPTADQLRMRARDALLAIGCRAELGEPGQHNDVEFIDARYHHRAAGSGELEGAPQRSL